mgnify:FL=1
MTGTIVVGVILSLMFLVSFTEWFYHIAAGVNEVIPSGALFYPSLIRMVVFSVLFIGIVLLVLSLAYECPKGDDEREGFFAYLDCTLYWQIRAKMAGVSVLTIQEQVLEARKELNN